MLSRDTYVIDWTYCRFLGFVHDQRVANGEYLPGAVNEILIKLNAPPCRRFVAAGSLSSNYDSALAVELRICRQGRQADPLNLRDWPRCERLLVERPLEPSTAQ